MRYTVVDYNGVSVLMGQYIIIEDDVVIGEGVKLGHNITLKSGTRIGNNVTMGDYVKTTGLCYIGNNVNIRTGATISKGVIMEDWVFIGPGIMTNHTKNVVYGRPHMPSFQYITRIGYGAIVGSMAQINAGAHIGDNVIIGAGAVVVKPLMDVGIYVGNTAKLLRPVHSRMKLERPFGYEVFNFSRELLEKYLSNVIELEMKLYP